MGKPMPPKTTADKPAKTNLTKRGKPKAAVAKAEPATRGNTKAVPSPKATAKTGQKRGLQDSASLSDSNKGVSKTKRVDKQNMPEMANNEEQEDERINTVQKLRSIALTYAQKFHGSLDEDVASPQILKTVQEILDSTSQTFRKDAEQETSRHDEAVDDSQAVVASASGGGRQRLRLDALKPQTSCKLKHEVKQEEDPEVPDKIEGLYCAKCQIVHRELFCPLKYVNFNNVASLEEVAFRRRLLAASERAGLRHDEEERRRRFHR